MGCGIIKFACAGRPQPSTICKRNPSGRARAFIHLSLGVSHSDTLPYSRSPRRTGLARALGFDWRLLCRDRFLPCDGHPGGKSGHWTGGTTFPSSLTLIAPLATENFFELPNSVWKRAVCLDTVAADWPMAIGAPAGELGCLFRTCEALPSRETSALTGFACASVRRAGLRIRLLSSMPAKCGIRRLD